MKANAEAYIKMKQAVTQAATNSSATPVKSFPLDTTFPEQKQGQKISKEQKQTRQSETLSETDDNSVAQPQDHDSDCSLASSKHEMFIKCIFDSFNSYSLDTRH